MSLPKSFDAYQKRIIEHAPLKDYLYMKVGGPADFLIEASTTDELIDLVTKARQANLPHLILGSGSNLLFTDQGFRGLVIVNRTHTVKEDPATGTLTADSGTPTNLVVQQANRAGLAGLAPFMGVPGSIGGATYNNAHFKTHQIGDVIAAVTVLNDANEVMTLNNRDCDFRYDHSVFQQTHHLILTITFHLLSGDPTALEQISKESVLHRKTTQPLEFASSGCIFKNLPEPGYKGITSAGALIDHCGLKGTKQGNAIVSDKHANFIINSGQATATDVLTLITTVQQTVKAKTGISLTPEVFIMDEHGKRIT